MLARKLLPNNKLKVKHAHTHTRPHKNEIKFIDDVSERNKTEIVNKKKIRAVYLQHENEII